MSLRPNLTISPATVGEPMLGAATIDALDRAAIGYLLLPLILFLAGWLVLAVAVPLLACVLYAARPLYLGGNARPAGGRPVGLTGPHLAVAVLVGSVWAVLGGTDHWVFANADWHMRDALLHDLVVARWPVGYGYLGGTSTLLRAPIAYFLPAALVGKAGGLPAAHVALLLWTAVGASLFLLQVLSLAPARLGAMLVVVTILVFFSGLDIVGTIIDVGPSDRTGGHLGTHLEWWAGRYQYSSMTTQLFWVPNHAFGAWLTIGLLARHERDSAIDGMLPLVLVAIALWSPFAALGCLPFVIWKGLDTLWRERALRLLHPRTWVPALAIGLAVAGYLTLDASGIPAGWASAPGEGVAMQLLRHLQFFLLEAGFIGIALVALRSSVEILLALLVLALLPFAVFGPGNDLVMRASIPSLAVLAIGCARALADVPADGRWRWKVALGGLLAVGAITPIHEFARSIQLPVWPVNTQATLVDADCGHFPTHYVARIGAAPLAGALRVPHALLPGPVLAANCDNPAFWLMWVWGVL